MSILSTKYYIFIKNQSLNFNEILNNLNRDNNNLRNWCLQYDFINCQLKDSLKNYPEFLNYSNFINFNSTKYNQNKILASTSMSPAQLSSAIVDNRCYTILNTINSIPNTYDELLKEYTFQNNYYNPYSEIYNKNLFLYNYKANEYVKNFSGLLNDLYNTSLNNYQISVLNNQSFFHLYFLQSLMNNYFTLYSTFKNNLLNNIDLYDINIDLAAVINKINIVSEVGKIVLSNQYNFNNISDSYLNKISINDTLQTSISEITNLFQNYFQSKYAEFKANYIETCFDQFNHAFTFDFINTNFNSTKLFNFAAINALTEGLYSASNLSEFENLQLLKSDYANTLNTFEQQMLLFYQNTLNTFSSLKQYFYVLCSYKTQFQKFINIIDIIASEYVINNINLNDIYYFNNPGHLQNLFNNWIKCIYHPPFLKSLNFKFSNQQQQQFLNLNSNIIKFSFVYEIYNIIEQFLKTEEFDNYLIKIQKDIYEYLRTNGDIPNNIDWCSCDLPLRVYFMSLLKEISLDSDFFDLTSTMEYLTNQITTSQYNNISNQEDFISYANNFIDQNATNMFSFYQTFLASLSGSVFAQAIHNLYKL